MKQQHSFVTRTLRSVVRDHEDLPAIHAGILVLSFLVSAMFRLGFFGMLIAVRMMADLVKGREVERRKWFGTLEGVLRGSLTDVSLLAFGFALAMVFHPALLPSTTVADLPLAIFTLTRGIGMTLPKLKILIDFLHVFFHLEQYMLTKNRSIGKSLTFPERASILLLVSSIALLAVLPVFLPIAWGDYVSLFLAECVPWRM